MKLLLVCGPFGSGTSAVAGLLGRLGAISFGPYHHIGDERTPNTYELIAFKELLQRLVSEPTLSLVPGIDATAELRTFRDRLANQEFGAFEANSTTPIVLKHALAAFVIPQICEVFETRLIYVIRPLPEIEATHQRRQWPGPYGADGAHTIYSSMFRALIDDVFPTMLVRYGELTASPLEHAQRLADFAGLKCSPEAIRAAAGFIRQTKAPAGAAAAPGCAT